MFIFKHIHWFVTLCLISVLASCSDDEKSFEHLYGSSEQKVYIKVESVGEVAKDKQLSRLNQTVNGIEPDQSIDRVVLIIMDRSNGMVVYKQTITDWSNTNNKNSVPYVSGEKRGRMAELSLKGNERLKMGVTYVVYAVGYHSGTYDNYIPFQQAQIGHFYKETEKPLLGNHEIPSEIYAGAQTLININGRIIANAKDPEISSEPAVRLRRQLAGTFAYISKIPVVEKGKRVARLRLVVTKRNQGIIFAGFRSQEDPNSFNKENVINGYWSRTDFDASLAGSKTPDAFTIYDIALNKWFPGDAVYPTDKNHDGVLDGNDSNWMIPQELASDKIKLAKGSVYSSGYLAPFTMTQEDIDQMKPTFQLQLLDTDGEILRYWNVDVRNQAELEAERTVVSIDSTVVGNIRIVTERNPETPQTYSVSRNSLYTLGSKNSDQSYGEDKPILLADEDTIIMDINPEWKALEAIIFN